MKNKTRKNKISYNDINKIIIKEGQQCITVHNSFEDTFKQFLDNKHGKFDPKIKDFSHVGEELIRAFKKPLAPKSVNPKDDFYTYVNYNWLKKMKSSKEEYYYTRIDSFRITQEKVYYQLIDIVKDYTSKHSDHKSKMIHNVYKSFLHLNESVCEKHWINIKKELDDIFENGTLYDLIIYMNKNETVSGFCPLSFSIITDEKDSLINRCHMYAPVLSFYDNDLYNYNKDDKDDKDDKDYKYKKKFNENFNEFVTHIFTLAFGKDNDYNSQDEIDVEKQLLDAMNSYDSNIKEAKDGYNVVTESEALNKYNIEWAHITKGLGFKSTPSFFITDNLNYLSKIMNILHDKDAWKSKKWKTYIYYCYFKQLMRFHNSWRVVYFNYFGKTVAGQTHIMPNDIYCIFGLAHCFNTFLTEQYISKYARGDYIKWASNLAYDLKTVFIRKIQRNKWLQPKTKKYAILKLKNIRVDMAHPPYLVPDPDLTYIENDPWGNLCKCNAWRLSIMIETEGKHYIDLPTIDWTAQTRFGLSGNQAYIVNAFYDPTKNNIYLPLAYLQKPFLDGDERGIEYNLAYLGFTIGHELSHSLDDLGSMYDYKGNLFNWWTPHDRKIFDLKVKDVTLQYETFAARDGIKIDGSLSVGENLADISGLAIVEEYLRDFQINDDYIMPIKKLSFETLFMFVTYQWRSYVSKKSIHTQIRMNPHPLDKYRANCPLSRLRLFKSIFNIKKGDGMYWEDDTIW